MNPIEPWRAGLGGGEADGGHEEPCRRAAGVQPTSYVVTFDGGHIDPMIENPSAQGPHPWRAIDHVNQAARRSTTR